MKELLHYFVNDIIDLVKCGASLFITFFSIKALLWGADEANLFFGLILFLVALLFQHLYFQQFLQKHGSMCTKYKRINWNADYIRICLLRLTVIFAPAVAIQLV